jgi:dsDNA-binding SOS-regulon protein
MLQVSLRILLLLVLMAWSLPANAQRFDNRDFITQLYREYYQRVPSSQELNVWLDGLKRGESPQEIHAAFIGSDEYFEKCGLNANTWLNNVFVAVTNRSPSSDEFRYWSQRLRQLGYDRRAMAREFLQTYGGQPVVPPRPSGGDPAAEQIASQMLSNSRQLTQNVRSEVSGFNGSLILLQANNLQSILQKSQKALENFQRDPLAAQLALNNIQLATKSLGTSLQSAPSAVNSRYYLNEITQAQRTLASVVSGLNPGTGGGGTIYPPINPPNRPGPSLTRDDARRVGREVDNLSDRANDTFYLVQSISSQDYRYRRLSADLSSFTGRVQALSRNTVEGYPLERLRNDLLSLENQLQNIDNSIRNLYVDVRVSQSWMNTTRAWSNLRSQATRVVGEFGNNNFQPNVPSVNTQLILQQIDRNIAQCDALLAQLNQYYLSSGAFGRMINDVRAIRNNLIQLRANVLAGYNPNVWRTDANAIRSSLNDANQAQQDVLRSARSTGQSAPSLTELNNSLQQLNQSLGL